MRQKPSCTTEKIGRCVLVEEEELDYFPVLLFEVKLRKLSSVSCFPNEVNSLTDGLTLLSRNRMESEKRYRTTQKSVFK